MRLDVYVHSVPDAETTRFNKTVLGKLNRIIDNEEFIMTTLEEAVTSAEAAAAAIASVENTVEAKFAIAIQMIADLAANQTDPAMAARVQAVADILAAKAAEFQADADTVVEPTV